MKNSVLLLSVLAVACMPTPGLDGRSGPEGAIGPKGAPGVVGSDGTDGTSPEPREASIAYVLPDRLNAGQDVMVQVVGHYTDWSDGSEATVDYPGVEVVGTQALGPVTLGITLRVALDVVPGVADLTIGELSLPSAFQVAPAAWFEFDEGYQNPVAPGAAFSGTIHLNGTHGVPVADSWNIQLVDHRGGLIVESGGADGNSLVGYQKVTFEGRIGAQVPAGPKSLAITVNNEVVVPVPNAIEVADAESSALVLDQAVEGDLANGDALFSMDLVEGNVLRIGVEGGDFVPTLSLTRPPVGEDETLMMYNNELAELETHSRALEFIVPKSGAWYLVLGSTEPLAEDADGNFSLTMTGIVPTPSMGRQHTQDLAAPSHGAWFSAPVAEGNLLGWRISAPEDSATQPIARRYFSGTFQDQDYVGAGLLVSEEPRRFFLRADGELNSFGNATNLTGQMHWQVLDAQLRGGEDHRVNFHFIAGPNGGATCADLEGLPIGIPRDELGAVSVLGQLTDEGNEDLGTMTCAPAGSRLADMVYKLVLTQPRRVQYHVRTEGGENGWRSSWTPMVSIETECANTETELFCSGAGEGSDFMGEDVAASETGGSVDLQPGTYVIRVQHEDGMFGDFTLSFWMDLLLEAIPAE